MGNFLPKVDIGLTVKGGDKALNNWAQHACERGGFLAELFKPVETGEDRLPIQLLALESYGRDAAMEAKFVAEVSIGQVRGVKIGVE